jgi:ubiquinone/menaquinone biosynthesis C-methylase UbiE
MPNNYIINHIGVDLSRDMLILAKNNLKDINVKKEFVCADFSSIEFQNEISNLAEKD